jgi:DNA-binding MarR family transcriptional regulator
MFDHCLYFNTTALARLVEREWTLAYKPFDLTPPQGFVLRAVLNRPGLLNRELAELLGIARPTATRLLDNLDAKHLIERRPSEGDGREWNIFPTEAGLALKAPITKASAEVAKRVRGQVGEQNFDAVVGTMRGIRDALA